MGAPRPEVAKAELRHSPFSYKVSSPSSFKSLSVCLTRDTAADAYARRGPCLSENDANLCLGHVELPDGGGSGGTLAACALGIPDLRCIVAPQQLGALLGRIWQQCREVLVVGAKVVPHGGVH